MEIDFSNAQTIIPEIQYAIPDLSATTYKYFIQYGKDTLIEILDPGIEIKSFTGCIKKLNYVKRESTFTCFIDQTRTYYTTKDSIRYSIEECKGFITNLCNEVELYKRCDSISFTVSSTNTEYKVIFKDKISNLRSDKLFYPDIQFLPYQIVGVGSGKNTMTLENVIYGKPSIDSLLQLYDYEGYEQITDEDLDSVTIRNVKELVKKLRNRQ